MGKFQNRSTCRNDATHWQVLCIMSDKITVRMPLEETNVLASAARRSGMGLNVMNSCSLEERLDSGYHGKSNGPSKLHLLQIRNLLGSNYEQAQRYFWKLDPVSSILGGS